MTIISPEDTGPLWPWVISASGRGWFGKEFEVDDGLRAVTHRSTDTIITCITTTDDDDILALGVDISAVLQLRVQEGLRVELKT